MVSADKAANNVVAVSRLHYINTLKQALTDLIEQAFKKTFKNEDTFYLACNDKKAFFTSTDHRGYKLWSCQNVCDALLYLWGNIYIRFGNKLRIQTNYWYSDGYKFAPPVAELFLICYENGLMGSLSDDDQADIIEAFNSKFRYLDDLLDIDNSYFEGMVNQIYPPEQQLNEA